MPFLSRSGGGQTASCTGSAQQDSKLVSSPLSLTLLLHTFTNPLHHTSHYTIPLDLSPSILAYTPPHFNSTLVQPPHSHPLLLTITFTLTTTIHSMSLVTPTNSTLTPTPLSHSLLAAHYRTSFLSIHASHHSQGLSGPIPLSRLPLPPPYAGSGSLGDDQAQNLMKEVEALKEQVCVCAGEALTMVAFGPFVIACASVRVRG